MFLEQRVHREHVDLVPAKQGAKLVVAEDLALVLGVLQVVLLDVCKKHNILNANGKTSNAN